MMTKTLHRWFAMVLVIGALLIVGCEQQGMSQSSSASPDASQATPTPLAQASPAATSNLPQLNGKATIEMLVKGAVVRMEVDGTEAPITAGNFVDLVQRGVYNGLVFHRVVRQPEPFVVQGGDPQSKNPNVPVEQLGTGSFVDPETSQPRYIPLEIKPSGAAKPLYHQTLSDAGISNSPKLKHTRGALAMARSTFPDSASSQFYIALADLGFLDGSYAVFGYVTDGMETVDKIQQGDRIESMKVVKGLENLKKS
jgi:peptidyl-prolyl cis-trans isomerase B (cyclophilin B)